MTPAALRVVMHLGGLAAELMDCTDADLDELHTWAVHVLERDRDEIAHVIACEQMRRNGNANRRG